MVKSKHNYRVYNGKKIKQSLENSKIYLLTVFFAVGILFGASVISKDYEIIEKIGNLAESFTALKAEQGIWQNFSNSVTVNSLFMFAELFFSFSLLGYPAIMVLPFFKGMGYGIVSGYLYSVYKFTGLCYSLMIIYPGAVVSTFAFVLASNDGCEYSKNAYLKSVRGRGHFEKKETKIFLLRQLIFFAACAASSLIDALLSAAFSKLFEI